MDIISIGMRTGPMFFLLALFAATDAMAQPAPIDLGTLGGTSSTPTAINDSGQVVGASRIASGVTHAFLWTPTSGMMDLGTLFPPGTSRAEAINNLGHIAVTGPPDPSFLIFFVAGAYLWTPDGGMVSVDQSRNGSVATAVNDVGQLVGAADVLGNNEQAFTWSAGGGARRLGRLGIGFPNWSVDVNNSGLVVGSSAMAPIPLHAAVHAFAWTESTGMVDLGTLGGRDSVPVDVNDAERRWLVLCR
jgi:probable HAF family extracellular repeat protein